MSDCVSVFCLFWRSFVELNVLKNRSLFVIHTILGNPGLQRGREGKGETESGKKFLPSLPIPFEALGFRGCIHTG